MPLALALVLHAHQPAGNFDSVIEQTYQSSYLPFVQAVEAHPRLKFNFHFSGYLLDHLRTAHPDYVERLRRLWAAGQVEMLSGGYYEPILAAIPREDQLQQIRRLTGTIEATVEAPAAARLDAPRQRLRGAWLAERVWEPDLPEALARAGIGYVLLDDSHFEAAGFAASDLHGYWWTESQGFAVRVVSSNFFLRQSMPFRPVEESLEFLLRAEQGSPSSLIAMGDDLEKFGSWPGTSSLVYGEGWLEKLFRTLEQHGEAIETVRLSEYMTSRPARGLVYLPTGSYPEMMEWAGNANWKGFLTKYREANLLHKTLWDLSRRLRHPDTASVPDAVSAEAPDAADPLAWTQARQHLLAAEANDVYWHGWFGGLYSPHLRNLAFTNLLQADAQLPPPVPAGAPPRRFDLHGDGGEVLELRTSRLRALVVPEDGGTLEELDFLPAAANCINSMQRRPEPYHDQIRQRAEHNPGHLPAQAAGDGAGHPLPPSPGDLDQLLVYDRYPRGCGRLYLCPPGTRVRDLLPGTHRLQHEASAELAAGGHAVEDVLPGRVRLRGNEVTKTWRAEDGKLSLVIELSAGQARECESAVEMTLNLLAPDASDRYFETAAGERHGLRWRGEIPPGALRVWDGWRRFGIELQASGLAGWWVEPLYSVSQSELGFEAIYQGSSVCALWPRGTRSLAVELNFFQ